jgi:hypothetical protein
LTNISDQIILVDKSNEAYVVEWYHFVNELQTPTQKGISKGVLFAVAKCGNLRASK